VIKKVKKCTALDKLTTWPKAMGCHFPLTGHGPRAQDAYRFIPWQLSV